MGKISKEYKNTYRYELENEIQTRYAGEAIDKKTLDKILDLLFDGYEHRAESDYKVVLRYNPYIKETPLQRLNSLWVVPLYLLTIAPIKWIITGEKGIDSDSKLYKIISKLAGGNH